MVTGIIEAEEIINLVAGVGHAIICSTIYENAMVYYKQVVVGCDGATKSNPKRIKEWNLDCKKQTDDKKEREKVMVVWFVCVL